MVKAGSRRFPSPQLGVQVLHPLPTFKERAFADIFQQFEFITKYVDEATQEIVGVKCRLCDKVILDEPTARQLLEHGVRSGKDPIMGAIALLSVPLAVWGAIHILTCTRKKLN